VAKKKDQSNSLWTEVRWCV